jgi:hypothetical protein
MVVVVHPGPGAATALGLGPDVVLRPGPDDSDGPHAATITTAVRGTRSARAAHDLNGSRILLGTAIGPLAGHLVVQRRSVTVALQVTAVEAVAERGPVAGLPVGSAAVHSGFSASGG